MVDKQAASRTVMVGAPTSTKRPACAPGRRSQLARHMRVDSNHHSIYPISPPQSIEYMIIRLHRVGRDVRRATALPVTPARKIAFQ
jgi:hypothetical protein